MNNIKPILIQGAMEIEIQLLKDVVEDIEEFTIDGYKFYKGALEKYPIIISKTDIGLINSAVSTIIGIKKFHPEIVINQGTAGASDLNLLTHDIVIGTNCININSFETCEKGEGEGINPFCWEMKTFKEGIDELIKVPANNELVEISKKVSKSYKKGKVVFGLIGSGDVWNKEYDRIDWLNKNYNVLCEDMETISIYSVCNKQHIPVIGVRAISDNARVEGQIYDRKSAFDSQKYVLEMCKEYIRSKTK